MQSLCSSSCACCVISLGADLCSQVTHEAFPGLTAGVRPLCNKVELWGLGSLRWMNDMNVRFNAVAQHFTWFFWKWEMCLRCFSASCINVYPEGFFVSVLTCIRAEIRPGVATQGWTVVGWMEVGHGKHERQETSLCCQVHGISTAVVLKLWHVDMIISLGKTAALVVTVFTFNQCCQDYSIKVTKLLTASKKKKMNYFFNYFVIFVNNY